MSEDTNPSPGYPRSKSLRKLASSLKLRRGSSVDDAPPGEKFPKSITKMTEYTVIDVGSYDHLSRKDGLEEVQKIDNINQAYFRYMAKRFGDIVNDVSEMKVLKSAISPSQIEKPPCYVDQYNLHRDRMSEFSVAKYEMCRVYLNMNGFSVFDPRLVDVSPHEHYIVPAKCVEPFKVIEKAEALAKERGDDITKLYQINLSQNANAQRFLAGQAPNVPRVATTMSSHAYPPASMVSGSVPSAPTSAVGTYPSLPNMVDSGPISLRRTSISRRDGWTSDTES